MWGEDRQGMEILALISVAVIAVLTLVGGQLNKIFEKISGKLTEAATKGNYPRKSKKRKREWGEDM
ncbi:Flp family type IVb pilin [Helcococcus ovis]|uniref:Flp family type IVb pilin n=1 Tax=Helcococcus ovis TaxID=72026 RepID=UPI0038B918C8